MEKLNNNKYHHIFKISILHKIKNGLGTLILLYTFIYIVIYLFKITNFSYHLLAFTYSILLIIYIFSILVFPINRRELIKISNNGIWVYNNSFYNWKDIKSMRIDKKDIILSLLNQGEFNDFYIYFKDENKKTVTANIHMIENRKTLVALANNYIEKNKQL